MKKRKVVNYQGQAPRELTETDVDRFLQDPYATPPKGIDEIRADIKRRNFVRWRRLQSDLRWLKREMKKRDMNPEDAPWLL